MTKTLDKNKEWLDNLIAWNKSLDYARQKYYARRAIRDVVLIVVMWAVIMASVAALILL
jgi:hypothetical protein